MQRMAKGLKSKYEDADILLVAPMLPNRDAYTFYGNQAYFYGALKEYETQGIAAVDVTGVHAGAFGSEALRGYDGQQRQSRQ